MKKTVALILIFASCLFLMPTARANALPQTSAKAAVVINAATNGKIYCKNEEQKLPMASTTKIMTALILCEEARLDETITVTDEMVAVEGSSMGLLGGDTVSYRDLLYGLLLASGNDAANTIAISLYGSVEAFACRMNERANQLGLKNTSFVTPSGLDAENHYTTAYDLACLAAYALNNEEFANACSSYKATLNYGNPPYKRTLKNHNKLLATYEGLIGVKTGFTKKSGRCLVTAAQRDGKRVVTVTLNDPNDWKDHTALLDYGLSQLIVKNLSNPLGQDEINVVGGKKLTAKIKPEIPFAALTADEWANISQKVELPRFVYAPNGNGQPIGKIKYTLYGKEFAQAPIELCENIDTAQIEPSFTKRVIKNFILMLKTV